MTHAEQPSRSWLDQALLDPGSAFARSEALVDHPELTPEQKIAVLRQAARPAGMTGQRPPCGAKP